MVLTRSCCFLCCLLCPCTPIWGFCLGDCLIDILICLINCHLNRSKSNLISFPELPGLCWEFLCSLSLSLSLWIVDGDIWLHSLPFTCSITDQVLFSFQTNSCTGSLSTVTNHLSVPASVYTTPSNLSSSSITFAVNFSQIGSVVSIRTWPDS